MGSSREAPAALAVLRGKAAELFGVDLRALAALRVGLAGVVLADLAQRAGDLIPFYTDDGVLPRAALVPLKHAWDFSIHSAAGGAPVIASLFVLQGVAALALLLGARTRLATALVWVLEWSLQNRNPLVLSGGDDLLRMRQPFRYICKAFDELLP